MTNCELLRQKVEACGITITYLAGKIGITREALYKKMRNETEFKASEISCVAKVLNLSQVDINEIFFVQSVN